MKNALLTGGAGFIGSHLAEKLLDQGWRVICLDNFNGFYDPKIKEKNIIQAVKNPNYDLIRGDILDEKLLNEIFSANRIQSIIHLAAIAGVRQSLLGPSDYVDVDIKGTVNLLEKAKEYKIRQFVFASSSSVYGINKKLPFSESDLVNLQASPYAAAKVAAELFCQVHHHLYGISTTILRFFTVYGPRQRPEMAIHKFVRLIDQGDPIPMFGGGASQRDYTYIDDIIDGILRAIDKNFDYEIFNLGNSNPIELSKLIKLIGNNLSKEVKLNSVADQPGDVPMTYADISKAKKMLGYSPKTSIEQGIEKFIKWYYEQNKN